MADYRAPGSYVEERASVVRGSTPDADRPTTEWGWLSVRLGEDAIRASLSLAVRVVDDFTDGPPRGAIDMSIEGVDATPARGRNGHYLFLDVDLPDDEPTVTVGGNPLYDDATVDLELSTDPDPAPPRINPRRTAAVVRLTPSTRYTFPSGTTLVRGVVRDTRDGRDALVEGATVSVTGTDRTGRTDEAGEFVVPLEGRPGDSGPSTVAVKREDGRWLTTVGGGDPQFVASGGEGIADDVSTPPASEPVESGRTTRITLPYV